MPGFTILISGVFVFCFRFRFLKIPLLAFLICYSGTQLWAVQHRLAPFEGYLQQWEDVVSKIDLSDKRIPAAYQALGNLAAAYGEETRFEDSIRYYRMAAELNPDFDKAWFGIGVSLMFQGNSEEAIKNLKKAIKVNALYKDAYFWLGRVYEGQGSFDLAAKNYELATYLVADKLDFESQVALGDVWLRQKKYKKAILVYQKVTRKYPDNMEAAHNYGIALTQSGSYKKSEEVLLRVVNQQPRNKKAQFNLGNTYLALKKYQKARLHFDQALQIDPNYTLALHGLGQSYLYSGNTKVAIGIFESILKKKPGFAPTISVLNHIRQSVDSTTNTNAP